MGKSGCAHSKTHVLKADVLVTKMYLKGKMCLKA